MLHWLIWIWSLYYGRCYFIQFKVAFMLLCMTADLTIAIITVIRFYLLKYRIMHHRYLILWRGVVIIASLCSSSLVSADIYLCNAFFISQFALDNWTPEANLMYAAISVVVLVHDWKYLQVYFSCRKKCNWIVLAVHYNTSLLCSFFGLLHCSKSLIKFTFKWFSTNDKRKCIF